MGKQWEKLPFMLLTLTLFLFFFFISSLSCSHSQEKVKIRFGITSGHMSESAIKDTKAAFELWLRRLALKKGYETSSEVKYCKTLGEIDSALASGEINCIGLSAIEYLSLKQKNQVMPVLSYFKNNSPYETYMLMVHRDSPCRNIRDLKGKNIVVEEGRKGIGPLFWLSTLLLEAKLPPHHNFFGFVKKEENASKSAVPLYFKQIDACIITRSSYKVLSEMNPQCSKSLRVLKESSPLVQNMVCISKTFPEKGKEDFISVGVTMASDIEGKQILMLFQLDALILFKEEHLRGAEDLKNLHDSLSHKNGKK